MTLKDKTAGRRLRMASPAMIVACLSLAVALSGASYAAVVLPRASVGTVQLKRNAVTTAKIKRNAVTTAKVKNKSLLAADFKTGQLPQATWGVADTTGNVAPAFAGSFLVRTLDVKLPKSGNLLVMGRVRSTTTCAASSCVGVYGLFVDGNPIPASAARQPSAASTTSAWDNIAVFGIAPNVAAGPHAVTMRVAGEGTWSVINFPDSQLTTVMLGGSGTGGAALSAGLRATKTSIVKP